MTHHSVVLLPLPVHLGVSFVYLPSSLLCFGPSLFLSELFWSRPAGVQVVGDNAPQPASLCVENDFCIFQEASRHSAPAPVHIPFYFQKMKARCKRNKSNTCKHTEARNLMHISKRRLQHEVCHISSWQNTWKNTLEVIGILVFVYCLHAFDCIRRYSYSECIWNLTYYNLHQMSLICILNKYNISKHQTFVMPTLLYNLYIY